MRVMNNPNHHIIIRSNFKKKNPHNNKTLVSRESGEIEMTTFNTKSDDADADATTSSSSRATTTFLPRDDKATNSPEVMGNGVEMTSGARFSREMSRGSIHADAAAAAAAASPDEG